MIFMKNKLKVAYFVCLWGVLISSKMIVVYLSMWFV